MAQLSDIKKSLSRLAQPEALALILRTREERRIAKPNVFKQVRAKEKSAKLATDKLIKNAKKLSKEERAELLRQLQEEEEKC